MVKRAILTVVTRNYAHYARVLMQACRRFHPEADLFICFADRPPTDWHESRSNAHLLFGDQLGIENWPRFSFQYTPFELACALKPYATSTVLERGYEQLLYIDGDILPYGPLTHPWDTLQQHSIVLTPHLLKPLPIDGQRPDESAFLASGAYNAGFYGVRNDAITQAFLTWWKAMCVRHSIVDMAASLFVDQKWLGLVPGLFEQVGILRHPGYNAGHWSLSQFRFTSAPVTPQSESGVALDGQPLVLFHFSGMTPNKPEEYLRSQTRTSLSEIPALARLVDDYHQQLAAAGLEACSAWGCGFDRLNDGTPIHPAWREAIRQPHPGLAGIIDPFDVQTQPELLKKYQSIEPGAYKWRRDWRLKWSREQGVSGKVRQAKSRLRDLFSGLKILRRSA